jgi:7,8-dihydropterin-6-yl-methyl-4-(beta-D-ribofuranosyl)aminobenzene 5'-phosphate synthase
MGGIDTDPCSHESAFTRPALNPDFVIPLHCTGESFFEIMKVEMPTKLLRGYTGTKFTFAA